MTQMLETIKKSIKNKLSESLQRLSLNVKYQKKRNIESSVLLLSAVTVQKNQAKNIKIGIFDTLKKIFGQKYAL